MMVGRWRSWLLLAGASLAIVGGLVLYVRPGAISSAFSTFDWRLTPLILGLVLADYGARFWRWRLLFRAATGKNLRLKDDVVLYLAGTAMIVTPARAGEWLKSVYSQRLYGISSAQTAPIPLVERLADMACMALLASAGAIGYAGGVEMVGIAALGAVGLLLMLRQPTVAVRVRHMPLLRRASASIEAFFTVSRTLLRPQPLAIALILGLIAWSLECLTFFVIIAGLSIDIGSGSLVQAAFIYPMSTLAGTLSFLPGGIGVAEGSITALTTRLVGLSPEKAIAAAILARLAIVGLPVGAGLGPLVLLSRRALATQSRDHRRDGLLVGHPVASDRAAQA